MRNPVIGISLDYETAHSPYPWYILKENYVCAVMDAGGTPILLPYHCEQIEHYLDLIDGLVIPGSTCDIPPAYYGETTCHEKVTILENRSTFEYALTKRALARDIPFLGVCGGQQLLNVVTGGTLMQHIPDEQPSDIQHEQKEPKHIPTHAVMIEAGTRLHSILDDLEIRVNSTHHQAVKALGQGCIVSARAPDGIIEAIEMPEKRFCIGVQWHPEYGSTPSDHKIFRALVGAART